MNRKKKLFLYISVVSSILFVIIFLSLYSGKSGGVEGEIEVPVRVTKPDIGTLQKVYRVSGYIESEHRITILPKISGVLVKFDIEVGDYVQRDETIIGEIDKDIHELNKKQAEIAYLSAKSSYERISNLYEAKGISFQEYEKAKSNYEVLKSKYEMALLNYNYTEITSPIDGVVLTKHVNRGELVSPQVPVVSIGDLKNLIVKAMIPEKYYYLFLDNREMEIFIDVPALNSENIRASLKTISPYISPKTKNFEVTCSLSERVEGLRPGMFIYIRFVLDKKNEIAFLPFETLVTRRYIWYITPEMRAKRLDIELGYFNDSFFEIPREFSDYSIVIDGQHFLSSNQRVKIINEDF